MFAVVLDSPLDIYEKENKLQPFNLYNLSICFYFVFFVFVFSWEPLLANFVSFRFTMHFHGFFKGKISRQLMKPLPVNQARWVIGNLRSKNSNYVIIGKHGNCLPKNSITQAIFQLQVC